MAREGRLRRDAPESVVEAAHRLAFEELLERYQRWAALRCAELESLRREYGAIVAARVRKAGLSCEAARAGVTYEPPGAHPAPPELCAGLEGGAGLHGRAADLARLQQAYARQLAEVDRQLAAERTAFAERLWALAAAPGMQPLRGFTVAYGGLSSAPDELELLVETLGGRLVPERADRTVPGQGSTLPALEESLWNI